MASKYNSTPSQSQSLSRASSTGSLHGGVGHDNPRYPNDTRIGNNPTTDDEDSDGGSHPMNVGANGGSASSGARSSSTSVSYKERRREAHTQAEQKRRDAIKKGYDYLQDLVPACQQVDSAGGHKVSKATVLQKSIDYIQFVQQQKKKQEDDLSLLRKEVIALQIMRANYEQLVKAHQSQPSTSEDFVPSEVKFQTFQLLMDTLFQSFNDHVRMNTFSELSGCVFSWLEEHCKPQLLQDLMCNILHQVRESYEAHDGGGPQRSIQAQEAEVARGRPTSQ
ncbi:max-like protein X [Tigriopus californicus]|uniref:max-like protein X n=1 Tax=Tigriopus californicus TaxID=6832 RepID=UPI0027DA278B|nr:max-like protein X [Tigriopus californicus]